MPVTCANAVPQMCSPKKSADRVVHPCRHLGFSRWFVDIPRPTRGRNGDIHRSCTGRTGGPGYPDRREAPAGHRDGPADRRPHRSGARRRPPARSRSASAAGPGRLRALPLPQRRTLVGLGWLAFAVSCALWVPTVPRPTSTTSDPSLDVGRRTSSELVTTIAAGARAGPAGVPRRGPRGPALGSTARTLLVVVTVLPVVVFGGGLDSLVGATYAAASLASPAADLAALRLTPPAPGRNRSTDPPGRGGPA